MSELSLAEQVVVARVMGHFDKNFNKKIVGDEVLGGLPSKQYTQGSRVDQLHCC